jgi:hypothetical protein
MRFKFDPADFDSCPQYNLWIDESHDNEHDPLEVFSFKPRPSKVLFQMSPDTYMAAFADFQTAYDEDLRRAAAEEYPSPIAHYFYRFEKGYENDLQRLHLLRDVWESVIDVLHALAVGEARFKRLPLGHPLKFSQLLSDKVADRLLNIEHISDAAAAANIILSFAKIAPQRVLEKMRELNRSRNAFSHIAAQSEAQARAWVDECYEDVLDVLDDVRGLIDCRLLRYIGQVDGSTLRCEIFKGHAFTRTIELIQLNKQQVVDSQRYFQVGQMLTLHDGILFGVTPLVFFKEDDVGHMTKPCIFRKTRGDAPNRKLEFAIVGNSVALEEDRSKFQAEMNELRALFGLGTD